MRPICCGCRRLCQHESAEAKFGEPGEGRRDAAKIDDHRLAPPVTTNAKRSRRNTTAAVDPFQSRVISERKLAQAAAVDFPPEKQSVSLSLIDRPVLVLAPLGLAIGINVAISIDHDSFNTGDCHKWPSTIIVLFAHNVANGENKSLGPRRTRAADFIPFRVVTASEVRSIIHDLPFEIRILASLACR